VVNIMGNIMKIVFIDTEQGFLFPILYCLLKLRLVYLIFSMDEECSAKYIGIIRPQL